MRPSIGHAQEKEKSDEEDDDGVGNARPWGRAGRVASDHGSALFETFSSLVVVVVGEERGGQDEGGTFVGQAIK